MLLFSSVNLLLLTCAIWALQQKKIDRELKKQVGILSLGCAAFSFLFFLVPLFNFIEGTQSDFLGAFFNDRQLVQLGLSSLLFLAGHFAVAALALKRYLSTTE